MKKGVAKTVVTRSLMTANPMSSAQSNAEWNINWNTVEIITDSSQVLTKVKQVQCMKYQKIHYYTIMSNQYLK
jgi:hypothetical protein